MHNARAAGRAQRAHATARAGFCSSSLTHIILHRSPPVCHRRLLLDIRGHGVLHGAKPSIGGGNVRLYSVLHGAKPSIASHRIA